MLHLQYVNITYYVILTYPFLLCVRWKDNQPPMKVNQYNMNYIYYVKKDTVIVPYGGYTVIRFVADNPGWWLRHIAT